MTCVVSVASDGAGTVRTHELRTVKKNVKPSGIALTASRRRSRAPTEARRAQLRGKFQGSRTGLPTSGCARSRATPASRHPAEQEDALTHLGHPALPGEHLSRRCVGRPREGSPNKLHGDFRPRGRPTDTTGRMRTGRGVAGPGSNPFSRSARQVRAVCRMRSAIVTLIASPVTFQHRWSG